MYIYGLIATDLLTKFQNNCKTANNYIAPSTLYQILQGDILYDIKTGQWT